MRGRAGTRDGRARTSTGTWGGRRTLLSAAAANAAAGTLFAWSALLPSLGAEQGRPTVDLGSVFSVALVAFAGAALLGGGMVDRHGPRRVTLLAGLVSGTGLGVGALAGNLLLLHLGIGVLFGLGSGLAYLSTVSWASTHEGPHRMWAVGVVVAAYAAGPVAAAPLGALAADRWGPGAALGVAAVVVAGVMTLASRGLPGPAARDGGAARSVPAEGPAGGPAGQSAGDRSRRRSGGPVGDAAGMATLWLFSLGAFVPGLLGFAYAGDIAIQGGLSAQHAGVAVAAMAVANVTGRLLAAALVHAIGLGATLVTTLGVVALALTTLTWLPGPVGLLAGLGLLGGQYGLVSALLPMATREVAAEGRFATAYGRVFSSWGVAGLLGPALGAALYDGTSGYARSFAAALAAVAVAALALAGYWHRGRAARRPSP